MVLRVLSSSLYTHDMTRAAELHPELRQGDVLVVIEVFVRLAIFACFYSLARIASCVFMIVRL